MFLAFFAQAWHENLWPYLFLVGAFLTILWAFFRPKQSSKKKNRRKPVKIKAAQEVRGQFKKTERFKNDTQDENDLRTESTQPSLGSAVAQPVVSSPDLEESSSMSFDTNAERDSDPNLQFSDSEVVSPEELGLDGETGVKASKSKTSPKSKRFRDPDEEPHDESVSSQTEHEAEPTLRLSDEFDFDFDDSDPQLDLEVESQSSSDGSTAQVVIAESNKQVGPVKNNSLDLEFDVEQIPDHQPARPFDANSSEASTAVESIDDASMSENTTLEIDERSNLTPVGSSQATSDSTTKKPSLISRIFGRSKSSDPTEPGFEKQVSADSTVESPGEKYQEHRAEAESEFYDETSSDSLDPAALAQFDNAGDSDIDLSETFEEPVADRNSDLAVSFEDVDQETLVIETANIEDDFDVEEASQFVEDSAKLRAKTDQPDALPTAEGSVEKNEAFVAAAAVVGAVEPRTDPQLVENLQDEVEQLKATNQSLRQALSESRQETDFLKSNTEQVDQLKSQLTELQSKIDAHDEQRNTTDAELETLRTELAEANQVREQTESRLDELLQQKSKQSESLNQLQSATEKAKASAFEMQQRLDQLNAEWKKDKQAKLEMAKKLSAAESELATFQTKMKVLEEKTAQQKNQLDQDIEFDQKQNSLLEKTEQELEHAKGRLQELENSEKESHQQLEKQTSELEKLQAEYDAAQKARIEAESVREELREKAEELAKQLAKAELSLNDLKIGDQAEKEELRDKAEELATQLAKAEASLAEFKTSAKTEKEELRDKAEELAKQLAKAELSLNDLKIGDQAEKEELRDKAEELAKQLAKAEASLAEFKTSAKTEKKQLRDKAKELAKQLAKAEASIAELKTAAEAASDAEPAEDIADLKVRFRKRLKQEYKKRKAAQRFLEEAEKQRDSIAVQLRELKSQMEN